MRAIPLARSARSRLDLEPILDPSGRLDARDTSAARRVVARLNRERIAQAAPPTDPTPARASAPAAAAPGPPAKRVAAGELIALTALDAVLHQVVEHERARGTDLGAAI